MFITLVSKETNVRDFNVLVTLKLTLVEKNKNDIDIIFITLYAYFSTIKFYIYGFYLRRIVSFIIENI